MRIGIMGLPSTGKTTLARALASKMHEHFDTIELITEYARDYIASNGTPVDLWEQYLITTKQIQRESDAKASLIVTDSPVLQGLIYAGSLYNPHKGLKHPQLMSDLFDTIIKYSASHPYDYLVILDKEVKIVDDGIRSTEQMTDKWRIEANATINYLLNITRPYTQIIRITEMDLDKRVGIIIKEFIDNREENYRG